MMFENGRSLKELFIELIQIGILSAIFLPIAAILDKMLPA